MATELRGCLLVVNQTLGGSVLQDEVETRIKNGRRSFYVVVPQIEPAARVPGRTLLQSPRGLSDSAAADRAAMDVARQRSLHRLTGLLNAIRAAGGEAEGTVSSTNAVVAVRRLLPRGSFDEVLICIPPRGVTRWLRRNLAARIARRTDVPVTVVEATAASSPRS